MPYYTSIRVPFKFQPQEFENFERHAIDRHTFSCIFCPTILKKENVKPHLSECSRIWKPNEEAETRVRHRASRFGTAQAKFFTLDSMVFWEKKSGIKVSEKTCIFRTLLEKSQFH